MYELVPIEDHVRWKKILESFKDADIYYNREYFLSALKLDPGEPFLFYYRDDHGEVAYPFIKRQLMKASTAYYDTTTPFGYGGPILKIVKNSAELIKSFRKEFSNFCTEENIIAEFIRFHPWKENALLFQEDLTIVPLYDTYSIDLSGHLSDFLPKNVEKKASLDIEEKEEPVVKKLGTVRHMFEFLVLYYSSIRRREESDSYYFFTNDYFEALISSQGPNLHLFGAYSQNKLVTACYVLTTENVIYHHLEGSLDESEVPAAMKALLLKIGEWGAENYYQYFHLGGDYQGDPAQSVNVKQEISNSNPATFYIGHKIHNKTIYKELVSEEETDIIKRYRNV